LSFHTSRYRAALLAIQLARLGSSEVFPNFPPQSTLSFLDCHTPPPGSPPSTSHNGNRPHTILDCRYTKAFLPPSSLALLELTAASFPSLFGNLLHPFLPFFYPPPFFFLFLFSFSCAQQMFPLACDVPSLMAGRTPGDCSHI